MRLHSTPGRREKRNHFLFFLFLEQCPHALRFWQASTSTEDFREPEVRLHKIVFSTSLISALIGDCRSTRGVAIHLSSQTFVHISHVGLHSLAPIFPSPHHLISPLATAQLFSLFFCQNISLQEFSPLCDLASLFSYSVHIFTVNASSALWSRICHSTAATSGSGSWRFFPRIQAHFDQNPRPCDEPPHFSHRPQCFRRRIGSSALALVSYHGWP